MWMVHPKLSIGSPDSVTLLPLSVSACWYVTLILLPLSDNSDYSSQVDFDRNGREIYREPEPAAEETQVAAPGGKSGSGGDIEEELMVFSGCKGKIIGSQGSVIKEIRASTGVTDIVLPPRPEDGEPRQRARDLVSITLKGSHAAVEMAKQKIMDIQDAWVGGTLKLDGYF